MVIWGDTRGIITWHHWRNHFYGSLLDSAMFWTSHHLCFQMQENSNITDTINWINLTFMLYDILLSYHRICIIHKQWTKKERLCIHYIWQQSYIKQSSSTFVLKLTSVCLCLQKMEGQKRKGICSEFYFIYLFFTVSSFVFCFLFFNDSYRKIIQDLFPEFTT